MILECCPNFSNCYENYLDKCQSSTESAFDCLDCVSCKCFILGYEKGAIAVVNKVNEFNSDVIDGRLGYMRGNAK